LASTGIAGVRLTDDFVADQRPKNWREGVLLLFPNGRAPLYALMSGVKSKVTDDPEFNWWEKEMPTQRVVVTNNVGVGTTFTAVSGSWRNAGVKVNSILRIEETHELVLVTALTATDATVTRDYGAAAPSPISWNPTAAGINPNVHVVGTAHQENSPAPGGISYDPLKKRNFTQIFRDNFAASRTAQKTRLRTAPAVREAKRETLEQHSANIEKALFFGRGLETTAGIGGEITRTTQGIYRFLLEGPGFNDVVGSNVITAPATITFADIEDWLEKCFRFGSSEKMAFLGNRAALTIQQAIRRSKGLSYNLDQGQKAFGMNVSRLVTPFGEIVMKTHPLFNQLASGSNGGTPYLALDSWMFILDMQEIVWRYLTDSDTHYIPDQQTNGLDGMLAGYLTEGGLELHFSKAHMVVRGIGTAVAE
jgi:hypothetical protein